MILCALYRLCVASTRCHVPREAILSKVPPWLRGYYKRFIREAERLGLIYRKGGTKSYGLTKAGVAVARRECVER